MLEYRYAKHNALFDDRVLSEIFEKIKKEKGEGEK
jgi:hypothetical protein